MPLVEPEQVDKEAAIRARFGRTYGAPVQKDKGQKLEDAIKMDPYVYRKDRQKGLYTNEDDYNTKLDAYCRELLEPPEVTAKRYRAKKGKLTPLQKEFCVEKTLLTNTMAPADAQGETRRKATRDLSDKANIAMHYLGCPANERVAKQATKNAARNVAERKARAEALALFMDGDEDRPDWFDPTARKKAMKGRGDDGDGDAPTRERASATWARKRPRLPKAIRLYDENGELLPFPEQEILITEVTIISEWKDHSDSI